MSDHPYNTREIQQLFQSVHEKIDRNREDAKEQLDRIELNGEETKDQVVFTNGKVRKIILALVLAFGLIIGLGFERLGPVLGILLAA